MTYSEGALRIVDLFVEHSDAGKPFDPTFNLNQLVAQTELADRDVRIAVDELSFFLRKTNANNYGPRSELFLKFDNRHKDWNGLDDVKRLARQIYERETIQSNPQDLADELGWSSRRLNPVLWYFRDECILINATAMGAHKFFLLSLDLHSNWPVAVSNILKE